MTTGPFSSIRWNHPTWKIRTHCMRERSQKPPILLLVGSSQPGWSLAMRTCVPSCIIHLSPLLVVPLPDAGVSHARGSWQCSRTPTTGSWRLAERSPPLL